MHEVEILTAAQLRDLIGPGHTTAIVPFGSIEHQGDHLPLAPTRYSQMRSDGR